MDTDTDTLERAAQAVYGRIVSFVREGPSAPPGFVETPWKALPEMIKQSWRDAVAAGLAAASQGQA